MEEMDQRRLVRKPEGHWFDTTLRLRLTVVSSASGCPLNN